MVRSLLTFSLWALAAMVSCAAAVLLVASVRADEIHAAPAPAAESVTVAAAPVAAPVPIAPEPAPVAMPTPTSKDAPFVVRSVLESGRSIDYGDYLWDESAGPADGTLVITVDLAAETLSVFRDGHEIGATAILFGDGDKKTPLGTFPISQKDKDHVSNLYHAPMPYMLRLTSDGISIHASEVEWGYATHGCIGVPLEFAKKLFAIAKLGDRVIVTRGTRKAIVHD